MEILMRGRAPLDYSEESAHTVEVTREENERGELGSFGFTLLYEKPPIVGTIVPGGPAERAGLKKNDVVISVNGRNVTTCSHKDVVGIIYHTLTPGVWLTVCEPSPKSSLAYEEGGGGRRRGLGNFSMSQSTPVLPRYTMEPRRTAYRDGPPPRYSEVERYQRKGSGDLLGHRAMVASVASISGNTRISPLKHVLTQSMQNGQGIHNSHSNSGQDLYGSSRSPKGSSPTPISGAFTSTSVLVQYIGPVELPETWSSRGLSSKCIQECTRRLLSQRHDFFEVFLEITVLGMKVLNVARNVLFKHKRDELYYCGICTDDEQYFAIVTRKLDQKVHKKEVIYSDGKVQHANICHVFKVVHGKSVLVLHSTDITAKSKLKQADVKTKTIPVTSCVAIIDAWKGLFASEGGGKLSVDSPSSGLNQSLRVGPSTSSFYSTGSSGSNDSNENVYGPSPDKSPQHSKKKKNEVVDLRPEAFSPGSSGALRLPSSPSTGNHYLSVDPTYVRTYQNREYSQLVSTPAFNHTGSGGLTWYSVDSPKDVVHSRSGSWDKGRSPSGNYGERYDRYGVVGGGRADMKKPGFQYDRVQKISDDESPSPLSSSRTPSPTKSLSFHSRSSYASHSHSPSPVSYSSGSRSRSQSPVKQRSPSPGPIGRPPRFDTPSVSKLSAGLALEMPMWRSGAMSPCPSSIVSSLKGSRVNLRRQGSESSVMGIGLQDHLYNQQTPHRGLPLKHTPLTSSTGSVTTLITVADEEGADGEVEELGRVAGWVASFDKLLADPLGVQCLLHLLEKEHCEENILFWRDAEEFKQKAPQMKNLQAAVKKLYDEYISTTAPRCINVDDRIQKAVESKLSNPPLNIFHEAQEHIYQLMKMDCYPRFKRSELAKQCILAEVEGRPLPFDMPSENKSSHDWKKQKESGRGRSLFARWSRARLKDMQQPQPLGSSWDTPPEGKKGRKESKASTKKEDSPLSKKATGGKETKGKTSDSKEGSIPEEFLPEDHLNVLQAHKGNIFELNLPNKVTKIMEVPTRGNVQKAIEPVLKKHGYSLDIIELRFANTFKLVDLKASASILIGQHVIVTRSKNTFIAVFPDVPEKILPADGTKSVGLLFNNVLRGVGKSQNFAIYMEGSRVPLELSVDTSVLVGQRVVVKYLPGVAKPTGSAGSSPGISSKNSKSSLNDSPASSRSGDRTEMDDLFSMIERLTTDTLDDQRTSPTPNATPEPGQHQETASPKSLTSSDNDLHKRQQQHQKHQHRSQQQKTSPPSGELEHKSVHTSKRRSSTHAKKRMSASKSSEQLLEQGSREKEHEGERRGVLPPTNPALSRSRFGRTQSGVAISSTIKSTITQQRSTSPPANLNSNVSNSLDILQQRDRSLTSPPPPLSRPPPLPSNYANQQQRRVHHRKMSSPAGVANRLSAGSFNSTGSEDSITTEYNHPASGQQPHDHLYVNRDNRSVSVGSMDVPSFFPNAFPTMERGQHARLGYTTSNPGPIYVNSSVQDKSNMPFHQSQTMNISNGREPGPREEYHQRLDNFVSHAYSNAPSTGNGHIRQLSAPGRQLEPSTAHPLQKSVRGSGTAFSSYPWHNAYPQRRISSTQQARTAAARKDLTENQELIKAGEKLVQKEINEYHRKGSEGGTSEPYKTPLSPTTHTLVLPDDDNSLNHQRETFV